MAKFCLSVGRSGTRKLSSLGASPLNLWTKAVTRDLAGGSAQIPVNMLSLGVRHDVSRGFNDYDNMGDWNLQDWKMTEHI